MTAPPKKAALKSVKNVSGKKAKVSLEAKVAGAAGYEVAYDISKKFTVVVLNMIKMSDSKLESDFFS